MGTQCTVVVSLSLVSWDMIYSRHSLSERTSYIQVYTLQSFIYDASRTEYMMAKIDNTL
jgi:hypothetical protein